MNIVRRFPPDQAIRNFRDWEAGMKDTNELLRHLDALWRNRFWKETAKITPGTYGGESQDGQTWVEVNRIQPWVMAYVAALHDPRMTVDVTQDYEETGDLDIVQAEARKWIGRDTTTRLTHEADKQATMYPGCAFLMGFDERKRNPMTRVWTQVVPWWELMLDTFTTGPVERFRARIYWMPLVDARLRFHDDKIPGMMRPTSVFDVPVGSGTSTMDADQVVRVLDVFNMVDDFWPGESDPLTHVPNPDYTPDLSNPDVRPIRGRREMYLPDLAEPMKPRLVMAMPFANADGEPVCPLVPHILFSSPAKPLEGNSAAGRVYDQFRETNIVRSKDATANRRDTAQMMYPKGLFDEVAMQVYKAGTYGAGMAYDPAKLEGYTGGIGAAVIPVPQPNLVYQNNNYVQQLNRELDNSTMMSPSRRGQISGGSATEVLKADEAAGDEISVIQTSKRCAQSELLGVWLCVTRASFAAASPDETVITTVNGKRRALRADDFKGSFAFEIRPGAPSALQKQRDLANFLQFSSFAKPLMDAVAATGDKNAAMILDRAVELAEMPDTFKSANIIANGPPKAPEVQAPRGPGAGSALPGHGSMPMPEPSAPDAPGGPQPGSEQPPDNQTGIAQNGVPGGP